MNPYRRCTARNIPAWPWWIVVFVAWGCQEPTVRSELPASKGNEKPAAAAKTQNPTNPASPMPPVQATQMPNGSSRPPAGPPTTTCATDADCIVTNFPGCCACPQCAKGPPRALTTSELAAEQANCITVTCEPNACARAGICPPGEDASRFVGRCRATACELERK